MKTVYVSDLEPGQQATGTFLVQHKEVRYKRAKTGAETGDPFLSLTLTDRTGELDAKMWDNVAGVMLSFEQDDFVEVKGVLQIHNNRKQFTIHRLQKLDESAVDLADFLPCSERDPAQMAAELRGFIEGVSNAHLRGLLELIFGDAGIMKRYMRAPAGKSVHHARIGGLAEHVLSVCQMCRAAARQYKGIDADLLIAGALVHDIGKIEELSYERSFGYTTEGQLLGHIAIGLRIIGDKVRELPDFPLRLRTLVEHMILSHHGELEFGSPKVPMFPEAVLLHYLEDLDAKMDCMRRVIEQDSNVEGHWTGYSAPLERVLLKKSEYMSGPAAAQTAAPAAPATLDDLASRLQAHFRGGERER